MTKPSTAKRTPGTYFDLIPVAAAKELANKQATAKPTESMPHDTLCPNCQRRGYVRLEHVISKQSSVIGCYCGACEHTWQLVESAGPVLPDTRRPPSAPREDRIKTTSL